MFPQRRTGAPELVADARIASRLSADFVKAAPGKVNRNEPDSDVAKRDATERVAPVRFRSATWVSLAPKRPPLTATPETNSATDSIVG